jgi:hypothetical protein
MKSPIMRIIFVPETSQSRTYEVSYRRLRMLRGLALGLSAAVTFLIVTGGTWLRVSRTCWSSRRRSL